MNIGKYEAEKLETATLRRSSPTANATVEVNRTTVKIIEMGLAIFAVSEMENF